VKCAYTTSSMTLFLLHRAYHTFFLFLFRVLFNTWNLECEKSLQVSGIDDMCKYMSELQIRYNGN